MPQYPSVRSSGCQRPSAIRRPGGYMPSQNRLTAAHGPLRGILRAPSWRSPLKGNNMVFSLLGMAANPRHVADDGQRACGGICRARAGAAGQASAVGPPR